jgi:hypothetical protein
MLFPHPKVPTKILDSKTLKMDEHIQAFYLLERLWLLKGGG